MHFPLGLKRLLQPNAVESLVPDYKVALSFILETSVYEVILKKIIQLFIN